MEILSKIGQTLPSVILIVEPPNLNESLNLAMMRFLVPHGEGRKDWEGRERKENVGNQRDALSVQEAWEQAGLWNTPGEQECLRKL